MSSVSSATPNSMARVCSRAENHVRTELTGRHSCTAPIRALRKCTAALTRTTALFTRSRLGTAASPFFPVAWANAGVNYFNGLIIPNKTIANKQRVDFWRANGGLRGNLGLGDWRYDANVQVSRTKARDDRQTPLAQRLTDVYVAELAPSGTPSQFTLTASLALLARGTSIPAPPTSPTGRITAILASRSTSLILRP